MVENDLTNDLYDKEICCPVCKANFKASIVKVNSPRITSKDSDLFIHYNGINPYFYEVWICESCGYSALKSDFTKIKSFQKDLVLSKITPKWRPREYPAIYDANVAIERYKLALITAVAIESPNSTLGIILLKTAWMYRLIEDNDHEQAFLLDARQVLEKAYMEEDFPIYGMQRDSLSYLIGDLYRLTGNDETALKWYSSVITSPASSSRIKDLARTGKDAIKLRNV